MAARTTIDRAGVNRSRTTLTRRSSDSDTSTMDSAARQRLGVALASGVSLAVLAAGCGGHGQSARKLLAANAVCRRDDARIGAMESRLVGNYSYATVQLIEGEV